MKFILGLAIVGGIVAALPWYAGGLNTFDPTQQGKDAKKAIGPGMTWTQVIDVADEPGKYQMVVMQIKKVLGEEVEVFKPAAPTKFKRQRLEERIAANELEHGFIFPYRFSEKVAFAVWFDGTGTVRHVENLMTMADLLDTRED